MGRNRKCAEIRNIKSVSVLMNEENFWYIRSEKSSDSVLFCIQHEALQCDIFKKLRADAYVFENSSVINVNRPASLYQAV